MRRALWWLALWATLAAAAPARAERYAVLVANNRGWGSEPRLRFTHDDARRLAATLKELGGFSPANVIVLTEAGPAEIERALKRLGGRARAAGAAATNTLLFFFYSGHGDGRSLHLGSSSLTYARLKSLIAGSPTRVRLTVVDACKSGAITLKGGRRGPAFDVRVHDSARVSGDIFLSAAARGESSQESARLKGSFFATYVTSGLRGAADANKDGVVTLSELYAYAYAKTVGRTSGTRAGAQHPSYLFNIRGRGDLVLTRPGKAQASLIIRRGARDRRYLVLRASDDSMVAEVPAARAKQTHIGLRPGRYKVRRWTRDAVLEQRVELASNERRMVRDAAMRPVILPHTLTKGELVSRTWSLGLGYALSPLDLEETVPAHRLQLSLRAPLGAWALATYLEWGHDRYEGDVMDVRTDLFSLALSVAYDIPTRFGLVELGPVVAYTLLDQGLQPWGSRLSSGLFAGGRVEYAVPLSLWRLAIGIDTWVGYSVYGLNEDPLHRFTIKTSALLKLWL